MRREATSRLAEVEVTVGRGSGRTRKRFMGRELDEFLLDDRAPGRLRGATVYLTRRGQLAAWCWSEPDWSARRTVGFASIFGQDEESPAGDGVDDQGWNDWGERHGEELVVAPGLDELALHLPLPPDAVQRLTALTSTSPVDVLDI